MSDKTTYREALIEAVRELASLREQEKHILFRKAQLSDTIKALTPLVSNQTPNINSLTLSNAIRKVFRSAGRPLTAMDVRSKLEDFGFDLSKFDNPMASIHTALNRMGDGDELRTVEDPGEKKKFNAGPDLKPVPETALGTPEGFVDSVMPELGDSDSAPAKNEK